MMISDIRRMMEPIHRRIMLLFARATVERVDDASDTQTLQVTALTDEVIDQLERCGAYGFTSNPVPGSAAIVLFSGGDRSNGVVVATDDNRYRVSGLASGEVAIYNNTGTKVVIKADGSIEISGGPVKVLDGSVEVILGDVTANGISLRHHFHGGVEPGGGVTGHPVIP